MPDRTLLQALAAALLAAGPEVADLIGQCRRTLGHPWRWIGPLARRYAAAFSGGGTRPRHRDVVAFLRADSALAQVFSRHRSRLQVAHWVPPSPRMQPAQAAQAWDLPPIESVADLAAWLGIGLAEIEWFADLKARNARSGRARLDHYHYRILAKPSGAVRLIEAPKPNLKRLQRRILIGILEAVPLHPCVHGFVKGRSILTFSAPHAGRGAVLRMDLRDFFPSISGPRVQALFRTMGYPERVADLLGGICTNAAPRGIWAAPLASAERAEVLAARSLYARPHLPQGSPASPALANICAWRADCRLTGLALAAGAVYSRYADDLAFSGDEEFARAAPRFALHAAAILLEEGFAVNHRKTRLMRRGVRQFLAGLVVNDRPNIARPDWERLEAILTNCVRHGPAGQNRDGHPQFRLHLEGRVAFVESIHEARGRRLRAILERIVWPVEGG